MRGKVFIAWSGTRSVAEKVKEILDNEHDYICYIGGNSDNNSQYSSVGDTIIQQIKSCNQAIVIFQNKQDGNVSNNVFFELGYVLARYGTRKIHCVKKSEEKIVLPSDFDSSFVEPISSTDEEAFARGIVYYFLKRQKMSIPEEKMTLIDNRYKIKEKIASHYSAAGSMCSDYELAQYIIFYMQAAHMFEDEKKVQKEIEKFHREHSTEFSLELRSSVKMCLSFFKLVSEIKVYPETSNVYIDEDTFCEFRESYDQIYDDLDLEDPEVDDYFSQWMRTYIYNHYSFVYMLLANNESLDMETRKDLHERAIDSSYKTLNNLVVLENSGKKDDSADVIGLDSLIRAYVYRNLYLSSDFLGKKEEAKEWLSKTVKERSKLRKNFEGIIDTQLQNTFFMEYYLAIIDYYCYMDSLDKKHNLNSMKKYLDEVSKDKKENAYLRRIALFYEKEMKK